MKSRFSWYLPPDISEVEDIWKNGELTVDANVLLDLYRYNDVTRESIISAMESFGSRAWISAQSAQEFFRNRKSVIASSDKEFREGAAILEELKSLSVEAISKLKKSRILKGEIVSKLELSSVKSIDDASRDLAAYRKAHPDYLKSDPILERLLALFDGKIGDEPDQDTYQALVSEGERRFAEKVPPGYLDDGKDGARAYGDFFLWRQTLDHAKKSRKAIILVTSERKEDWWERQSGKIVGSRPELYREAYDYAGQRVLIYQTERFLEMFSQRSGKEVSAEAVTEIREINSRRPTEPAVRVTQVVKEADSFDNSGTLEIELLRPLQNLTGSGRLSPHLLEVPSTSVSLVSAPDGCPPISVRAGSGTVYDFNVHIKSNVAGTPLAVGTYRFEYQSTVWENLLDDLDDVDEDE